MQKRFSAIAGNKALLTRLGAELAGGSLSHAYIIEGPAGSGKRTLARELILSLACEHRGDASYPLPCRSCPACKKIAAGYSPDVFQVERESGKAFINVDAVRELREGLAVVPNDLPFKVYVINDAHTMNLQAQNALLLTLEEPPPFVLFLLLTESAGALLETIRSRAPVLRMQPLSDEEMRTLLLTPDPQKPQVARAAADLAQNAPDELAAVLSAANGAAGRAITLLEEGARREMLEGRSAVAEVCRLLARRARSSELLTALLALGTDREEVLSRLLLLKTALRDLLALNCTEGAPLVFFIDRDDALTLAECFSVNRLFALQGALEQTEAVLLENANLRLALIRLFNEITA